MFKLSQIQTKRLEIASCNFQHFLLMGDFNFPMINWISECTNVPENHLAEGFLTCV